MSKIILLSSHFLPNDGGIARLTTELHEELKANNDSYQVLLLENEIVKTSENIFQIKGFRIFKEIIAFLHVRKHKGIIISAIWYPEGLIASLSSARQKIILVHGTELLPNRNIFKEFFQKNKKISIKKS